MFDGDSISSINFQFIEENLSNIIKSQKNLENISFNFDSLHLYNSLNSPSHSSPYPKLNINLSIKRDRMAKMAGSHTCVMASNK
ncbi:uncharacterized protein OCT59_001559 [Rhizophagus irregularis]|uniref:uncharacterized protein n=1 Tax=Rhizophagus irregularis TaxID=588596 RepID=UPI003316D1DD|nr:hypothetical protein OCT59_001559 [Rhizophagus irregularis]